MWTHTSTHTLAHIIYIMHFCTFPSPSSRSLFCSLKQTHTHAPPYSCKPTHTHTHALTHVQTHQKPSAYVMQHEGQGQGINSRESGTGVGGVWEDHMHFTRHWWKHARTLNHTCLSHEKKQQKNPIYSPISFLVYLSLSLSFLLTHTSTYSKSCTGFRWYTPTGILILPQNHLWLVEKKKLKSTGLAVWAGGKSWRSAIQWWWW